MRAAARLTFRDLLDFGAIADLAADAKSIARHSRWDWFPDWIGGFRGFHAAVQDAADRLQRPLREVRDVALVGLLDTWREEKRRLAGRDER